MGENVILITSITRKNRICVQLDVFLISHWQGASKQEVLSQCGQILATLTDGCPGLDQHWFTSRVCWGISIQAAAADSSYSFIIGEL